MAPCCYLPQQEYIERRLAGGRFTRSKLIFRCSEATSLSMDTPSSLTHWRTVRQEFHRVPDYNLSARPSADVQPWACRNLHLIKASNSWHHAEISLSRNTLSSDSLVSISPGVSLIF